MKNKVYITICTHTYIKSMNHELCDMCENTANTMCSGCNLAVYCSKRCQNKEWDEHQHVCWKDSEEHVGTIYTRYKSRKERRKARKDGKEARKAAKHRRREERKDWWDSKKERFHKKFFGPKEVDEL